MSSGQNCSYRDAPPPVTWPVNVASNVPVESDHIPPSALPPVMGAEPCPTQIPKSSHCQLTVITGRSGETMILTNESPKDVPIENPSELGKNPVSQGTISALAGGATAIENRITRIANDETAEVRMPDWIIE